MTRTFKRGGGLFDIFSRKAKTKVKNKTRHVNGGIRNRHHADPINTVIDKYEGRNASEWQL